jgi:hypothetical protein
MRTGLILVLAVTLLAGVIVFVSTQNANSPGTTEASNDATRIEAPGTSVQSDETGTRVQAPGVDITVPAAKDRDPG